MYDSCEEIIEYCRIKEPAGALLVIGQWGSGKTFLVNHTVRERLKDSHIFIKISLFGIPDAATLERKIKLAWFELEGTVAVGLNKIGHLVKNLDGILESIPKVSNYKNLIKNAVSVNFLDFIKIKSQRDGKQVVLIFDDLERATMNMTDILGMINGFIETDHISTIIIANEKRIDKDQNPDGLKYEDIKEKLVQRTINLKPNYETVVPVLINDLKVKNQYKTFLEEYQRPLIQLLSGLSKEGVPLENIGRYNVRADSRFKEKNDIDDEERRKRELLKKRPHNLRSVKCALQDFERVYDLLVEYNIPRKENWYYSFITAMLAFRANLLKKHSEYGWLFSQTEMDVLYPGYFYYSCIGEPLMNWCGCGEWDESAIKNHFHRISQEIINAKDPLFCMKYNLLYNLDESIIDSQFPVVLEQGYEGTLSFEEYLMLLMNIEIANHYNYSLPCDVDEGRLETGLNRKVDNIDSEDDVEKLREALHNVTRNGLLKENHMRLYLDDYVQNDLYFCRENRDKYLNLMRENAEAGFSFAEGSKFDCFDIEIAEATFEAFKEADNYKKSRYIESFKKTWMDRDIIATIQKSMLTT